jgi:hydrogenase small subunit
MDASDGWLMRALTQRRVSRRAFLEFSASMAGILALPRSYAPVIAEAVAAAPRIPVIWREGQDCAGNTEGFLRASHPTVSELILEILSVDYHETIMAPSGARAEQSMTDTMERFPNGYIAVIEGAIPFGQGGVFCTIGGRAFTDIAREVCEGALAVIAVGTCALDGGLPAAAGGPTDARGVADVAPGATLINLPGCPMNVQNLTATIVHYLTFGAWPATDPMRRPLFAYGQLLHDQCERRAHFEQGEYALAWGDEGHRKGWCLYKLGCKGPETYANCPTARFNDGASWPVKAGHGCVGCTMHTFWDQMSPFYRRLPPPPPFATDVTADQVGMVFVGSEAALAVAHGTASYVRARRQRARAETVTIELDGHAGGQPPPASEGEGPAAPPGAAAEGPAEPPRREEGGDR